jgi:hypothetical protein
MRSSADEDGFAILRLADVQGWLAASPVDTGIRIVGISDVAVRTPRAAQPPSPPPGRFRLRDRLPRLEGPAELQPAAAAAADARPAPPMPVCRPRYRSSRRCSTCSTSAPAPTLLAVPDTRRRERLEDRRVDPARQLSQLVEGQPQLLGSAGERTWRRTGYRPASRRGGKSARAGASRYDPVRRPVRSIAPDRPLPRSGSVHRWEQDFHISEAPALTDLFIEVSEHLSYASTLQKRSGGAAVAARDGPSRRLPWDGSCRVRRR